MPNISIHLPHQLGADEAKRRIDHLIADTRKEFGHMISDLDERWEEDLEKFSFRAMGFAVSGTIAVAPAAVDIEMQIPLAALPFKHRVESKLRRHAAELLA